MMFPVVVGLIGALGFNICHAVEADNVADHEIQTRGGSFSR